MFCSECILLNIHFFAFPSFVANELFTFFEVYPVSSSFGGETFFELERSATCKQKYCYTLKYCRSHLNKRRSIIHKKPPCSSCHSHRYYGVRYASVLQPISWFWIVYLYMLSAFDVISFHFDMHKKIFSNRYMEHL